MNPRTLSPNLTRDERTRVVLARTQIDNILDAAEAIAEDQISVSIRIELIAVKAEFKPPLTLREVAALMQTYKDEGLRVSFKGAQLHFTGQWFQKTPKRRRR